MYLPTTLPLRVSNEWLISKTDFTFQLWLITFGPLELKQNCTHLLKIIMCGTNVFGAYWHGSILILCHNLTI